MWTRGFLCQRVWRTVFYYFWFIFCSLGLNSLGYQLHSEGAQIYTLSETTQFPLLSLCKQEINQLVWLPSDLEKPAFLHEFKPKPGMGICSEYGLSLNENQPEIGPRLLKALQIISGLLGEFCPAVVITDALQQLLYQWKSVLGLCKDGRYLFICYTTAEGESKFHLVELKLEGLTAFSHSSPKKSLLVQHLVTSDIFSRWVPFVSSVTTSVMWQICFRQ